MKQSLKQIGIGMPPTFSLSLRSASIVLIFALSFFPCFAAPSSFFVSPRGSDQNDGLSEKSSFRTLEAAQNAMRQSKIKKTLILKGVFLRSSRLILSRQDEEETWLGMSGAVLNGKNNVDIAIEVDADNISIGNIEIENFKRDGIFSENAANLQVTGNYIHNIDSDGWNQGAIALLHSAINAKIEKNRIENVNYAGILVATATPDRVDGLQITSNRLRSTCLLVSDCGGIYVNDRGHHSNGIQIAFNILQDYGALNTKNWAIYLDDQISNTRVHDNVVFGSGQYVIQLHGGDHNLIYRNLFDISKSQNVALYDYEGPGAPNYGMRDNLFTCNIFYSTSAWPMNTWRINISELDSLPELARNNYWDERGVVPLNSLIPTERRRELLRPRIRTGGDAVGSLPSVSRWPSCAEVGTWEARGRSS